MKRRNSLSPLHLLLALGAMSLALAGCGAGAADSESGSETGAESESGSETGNTPTWEELDSDAPHDEAPTLSDAEQEALVVSQFDLSMRLFHELRGTEFPDAGFSVSAPSIQTAFGMLMPAISDDPPLDEVMDVLGFDTLGEARTHVAMNWQDAQLRARNLDAIVDPMNPADAVLVDVANGLWVIPQLSAAIEGEILDTLATHYDVGAYIADFSVDAELQRSQINSWVEDRTRGLLPELFPSGSIRATTTMVFANAIYLKAPWAEPFEEEGTVDALFTRRDGSAVMVPTMRSGYSGVHADYRTGSDYDAVSVPLRGGSLELFMMMPHADYESFEASFDGPGLRAAMQDLSSGNIELYLPRFELEPSGSPSIKRALQSMGLAMIFDGGAIIGGDVTDVLHQTSLAIDEKGVEAAAATGIVVGESGTGAGPEATLRFDRPFMVVLEDRVSGTPLFVGRVLDPS